MRESQAVSTVQVSGSLLGSDTDLPNKMAEDFSDFEQEFDISFSSQDVDGEIC